MAWGGYSTRRQTPGPAGTRLGRCQVSGEVRVCAVGDIDESAGNDIPVPMPTPTFATTDADTVRSVASADGEVRLSISQDLPVLRQWMIEHAIHGGEVVWQPANMVSIGLPVAGVVRFYPNQIRALSTALATAMAMEAERGVPVPPERNAVQADPMNGPDEQRVIHDLMLRRGRELMRDHGLSATQAASVVREMVARGRLQDLISVHTAPTAHEAREFVNMEAEGRMHAREDAVARSPEALTRWQPDTGYVIPLPDGGTSGRVLVTDENGVANWQTIPMQGHDDEPDVLAMELGANREPTLREVWGD